MIKTILLLLPIWLSACAGQQPKPAEPPQAPSQVNKAVTVSCVKEMPVMPNIHSREELLAMAPYNFVTTLHADRLKLEKYADELSAALQACK
jgi:hypothetical protein